MIFRRALKIITRKQEEEDVMDWKALVIPFMHQRIFINSKSSYAINPLQNARWVDNCLRKLWRMQRPVVAGGNSFCTTSVKSTMTAIVEVCAITAAIQRKSMKSRMKLRRH